MYIIHRNDSPLYRGIAMAWHKVLPDGNYDVDGFIKVIQEHKDELGIELDNQDIAEIINERIMAINRYMTNGSVVFVPMNYWVEG